MSQSHFSKVVAHYAARAEEFSVRYNALDRLKLHEDLLKLLPQGRKLHVLDVGAGSGADANMFAEQGHSVVAAEPVDSLREIARKNFNNKNITWISDALPELPHVRGLKQAFDIVTTVGVLHHLEQKDRAAALKTVVGLLAAGGIADIQYPVISDTALPEDVHLSISDKEIKNLINLINKDSPTVAVLREDTVEAAMKRTDGSKILLKNILLRKL